MRSKDFGNSAVPGHRTFAVALALMALTALVSPARAQEPGEHALHGYWGVGLMVAEPVGEFADVVDTGWGLEGHLRLPVDERPLSIRLDLGIVEYGRERKRVCLSATVGCRIQVDLVTTNYIAFGSLGPQLGVTRGPIRPYVTAGLGFAYFATESRIEDVDDFDQGHFSTTNFSDFTLALTGTAGFQVQLSSGRTPVSLDLAVRYHRNGDAEYLTENDIVDEPDGSITIFPNRSDANLLTFQLGVSVGIPVGEESSG